MKGMHRYGNLPHAKGKMLDALKYYDQCKYDQPMAMLNAQDSRWVMLNDMIMLPKGNFTPYWKEGKAKITVSSILLQVIIIMMALPYAK